LSKSPCFKGFFASDVLDNEVIKMKTVITLSSLNANVSAAANALHFLPADATEEVIAAAKEQLRKAREAVRIFSYKAKPCFTRSGKALRP
jgi:hypothetical protein